MWVVFLWNKLASSVSALLTHAQFSFSICVCVLECVCDCVFVCLTSHMGAFCWPQRPSKYNTRPSPPPPPFGFCLNSSSSFFSFLFSLCVSRPSLLSLCPSPSPSAVCVFVFSRPACLSNSKYPCYLTQIHLSTWPRTRRRAAACVHVWVKQCILKWPSAPWFKGLTEHTLTHTHTLTHAPPSSPLLWDKTQV